MFKEYTFVFDIDGTLCPIKKKEEKYEDLVPYKNMVNKLRYYKEKTQTLNPNSNDKKTLTIDDYIKLLTLLKTPTFSQMIGTLSIKDAIIISLKLGL